MNSATIYKKATTPKQDQQERLGQDQIKEESSTFESGIKEQIRDEWLSHPLTKELLYTLVAQMSSKLDSAMSMASIIENRDACQVILVQAETINSTIRLMKEGKK